MIPSAIRIMSNCWSLVTQLRFGFFLALLMASICALPHTVTAREDTKTQKDSPPPKKSPSPPGKVEKQPRKKLNGAELYALNCNRCHAERYAPERTADQWKTIMLHMRTRANIPAEQARAILQYLQDDSGK